ncbi:MAG: hypothetical protein Q8S54_04060 [Bacteroidota bacterium]|nr:hypothetical protein [Odoribacter sp.]MDP3642350.1 hypothetical protein [Bacteroidota bacterium]
MTGKICFAISMFILLICQSNAQSVNLDKIFGERINGPANIRDTINGKVLFELDDNILVECTEDKNNWHIIGLDIRVNSTQIKNFKLAKGDTLFRINGEKIGIAINETRLWRADENNGIETAFVIGYTFNGNIKPESVIENALTKIILEKRNEVFFNDLKGLIDSFQLRKFNPANQPNANGEWYYFDDNLIEDISPRDRITLIMENKKLIGVVHSHKLNLKSQKSYELIRGHKFTPIVNLTQEQIGTIIKERINWYNSID